MTQLKPANVKFLRRTQHMSYEQAERRYFNGYLSQRDWDRYCRIWHWAAVLHSSEQQNRCYSKYGPDVRLARINRLRRVLGLTEYK